MSLTDDLEFAVTIAREAGAVAMRFYTPSIAVERKAGGEPVTAADEAANELLVGRIQVRYPRDAVLAEESPPGDDRFQAHRVWMIDPLDGTKEFIARNGEFAVMVGLAVDGRPMVGAVYQPDGDVLYLGAVGVGAWIERAGGKREPLAASREPDPAKMRLAVSRSHKPKIVDQICRQLGITHETPSGSVGLKIGMISTQRADLYLHPSGGTKDWDTCAPEAIVHAAGGKITDVFGEPLRYREADVENRTGVVASNGMAHERIIEAVAPLCEHLRAG
jgi:3'(2'), 5'-bisphosphate nucleotidase